MTRAAPTVTLGVGSAVEEGPPVTGAVVERSERSDQRDGLIALAQHGDAAAFDALAAARIDRSYRLALAILRSEADARDAVQEAYIGAWKQLPRLRDRRCFDAWLDRILVNACRMALRHRRVVHVHEIDFGDPVQTSTANEDVWSPSADAGVAEADAVARAFEHLDADQRAILVLHHVEDRPIDAIADVLGIPGGTVKWRLHRARTALQRALEEESR